MNGNHQQLFVQTMLDLKEYWNSLDISAEEKLEGFSHSVCTLLDGSTSMGQYSLRPCDLNGKPLNIELTGSLHECLADNKD